MEQYSRTTKSTALRAYDHFAKEHDFIEVTEWYNGEGFDVTISEKHFSLTWGQLDALNALVLYKG